MRATSLCAALRIAQAFCKSGFPPDSKVFTKDPATIVRKEHCGGPDGMRGKEMQVSCCLTNPRNVCQAELREKGLAVQQEAMHRMLVRLADHVGKTRSNAAEVLALFEFRGHRRHFGLLTKGIFSPKVQMWAVLDWSADNEQWADEADIRCPFNLVLTCTESRLCKGMTIPHIITSDELATKFAEEGGPCKVALLDFEEPLGAADLLKLVVIGREDKDFSAPLGRSAAPRNAALADLRDLRSASGGNFAESVAGAGGQLGGRRAAPKQRAAGTSSSLGSHSPALPGGLPAALPEHQPIEDGGIDALSDGHGDVGDLSDSDVAEMLSASGPEAEDEETEAGAAISARSSVTEGPLVPELITGPSPLGYYRNTALGRDVARVSGPFSGSSMAVRCFLHPKCTLAITAWKLPSPEKLKEWILSVRAPAGDDNAAIKAALAKEHMDKLRALRDAATR